MHPKDIKNILAQQPFETVSAHMHMVSVAVCVREREKEWVGASVCVCVFAFQIFKSILGVILSACPHRPALCTSL